MYLTHDQGIFTLVCTYEERFSAKNAGFKWNPDLKKWQTTSPRTAQAFAHVADPECRAILSREQAKAKELHAASMATEAELDIPHPEGFDYFPFQKAGVKFCLRRDPIRTLLGDEMGLGKTPQTIGVINMREDIKSVLIICPASLKINWRRELDRWLTRNLTVGLVSSDKSVPDADILLVNYDILGQACPCYKVAEQNAIAAGLPKPKKKRPDKNCTVCHGKGFSVRMPALIKPYDLIVCDEAHRLKNQDTLTYKAFKIICDVKHRMALTGTPILNRPIEMQTTLAWLDHVEWGNRWEYAKRYCALTQNRFGVDMSGASNLEELRDRLRSTVLIRRLKKDVLKELPPKIHQIIELPANGLSESIAQEWQAYKNQESVLVQLKAALEVAKSAETDDEYQNAIASLRDGVAASFAEMSYARLDLAKRKVPYIVAHMSEIMEQVDKLVAFGHHTEVIEEVVSKMANYNPVKITGAASMLARDKAVQSFQNDPGTHLFVGNIIAAGVGLTLTAASNVVLFELDWRPGIVAQAIDRCHRIGQTDSVTAQYLVLEGSLDAYMAKKIAAKQKIIDTALGVSDMIDSEAQIELPSQEEPGATESTTRKQIIEKSALVQPGDAEVVLSCLRTITAADMDYATGKNEVGWSKLDSHIGHSLSEQHSLSPRQIVLGAKLCWRHKRQLNIGQLGKLEQIQRRLS